MKTLRIAATCAVALSVGYVGHAWAQDQPATAPGAQTTQDVGGMPDASVSQSGRAMGETRADVYQDLQRFRQSGDQQRLNSSLYHGK